MADAEETSGVRVTLLFGTQTGTAERFAKQLKAELSERYGPDTQYVIRDIEEYDGESRLATEQLVLFLMATYGDGEPTDNAVEFFTWLTGAGQAAENGEGEQLLKSVRFGVFGLGNKQYEHFAAVGKRVHAALEQLGAEAVVPRGDGDDDEDIDADFDRWRAQLYEGLDSGGLLMPVKGAKSSAVTEVAAASSVPAYSVEVMTGAEAREVSPLCSSDGSGHNAANPYAARLAVIRELHSRKSDRSCLHVELDIQGSELTYEAGDHVAIFAQNSPAMVEEVGRMLGLPLDTVFRLSLPSGSQGELSPPFPGPCSLRSALARYADVTAPIKKAALQALSACASSEVEAARLRHLTSAEGHTEYQEWIAAPSRSLLEVMRAFPSVTPSLGAFFGSIAPRLQPRYYSISSSPRAHPDCIHITCAVVVDRTPTGRLHEGIASMHLRRAAVGERVPMFVRRSHLKLPADPAAPLVMIGPGTGIAPFRGFLQERLALAKAGTQLGPALLYFGCRKKSHDFIYEAELSQALKQGAISQLSVAFSRDGPVKDYVQHHMERQAVKLWPLLASGSNGHVYVCGDAKHMARDVHKALLAVAQQAGSLDGQAAEAAVKQLSDSNRYQRDVW